jgi:hypothetical protein
MRRLATILVLTTLVAACGDDDAAGPETTATDDAAITTVPTTPPALPDGCVMPPFEVEVRIAGEDPAEVLEVVDAAAVRISEGKAYTVYLADFVMDRDESIYVWSQEPPPGGTIVQTGLTVFNAEDPAAVPVLRGGETGFVDWQAGELAAFLTVIAEGAADFSVEMTGSAELLHVDDARVCIRADIRSERGFEFAGTYLAEIVDDF